MRRFTKARGDFPEVVSACEQQRDKVLQTQRRTRLIALNRLMGQAAAAQLDVDLARAGLRLTKAERFEDWRVGVSYERDKSAGGVPE